MTLGDGRERVGETGVLEVRAVGVLFSLTAFFSLIVALHAWGGALGLATLTFAGALLVSGIAAAGAVAGYLLWNAQHRGVETFPRAAQSAPVPDDRFERRMVRVVTILVASLVVFLFLVAFALPVSDFDGLAYHLPAMNGWMVQGRVHWILTDVPHVNGYPMNVELLGAHLATVLRTDALADAKQIFLLMFGALGLWVTARLIGIRRGPAALAACAWLAVPINILQAPTAYVDAAFAGLLLVAFAWLLLLAAEPEGTRGKSLRVVGLGLSLGLMAGAKGPGIVFALVLLAAAAALCWKRGGLRLEMPVVAIALPLLVLTGCFWHLRNWTVTGNPFWPMRVEIFGWWVFPAGVDLSGVIGLPNIPKSLLKLPDGVRWIFTWVQPFGPACIQDYRIGGLGYGWPLFGLPCLIVAAWIAFRERKSTAARLLLILTVVTLILFVLQPFRWWSRYTVWLWGAGLISAAWLYQRLRVRRPSPAAVLLVAFLVLMGAEGLYALIHCKPSLIYFVRGENAATHAIAGKIPQISRDSRVWDALQDRRIARGPWRGVSEQMEGFLCSPLGKRQIIPVRDAHWATVVEDFNASGCRYLFLDPCSPAADDALRDPAFELVERGEYFLLLRRRAPDLAS